MIVIFSIRPSTEKVISKQGSTDKVWSKVTVKSSQVNTYSAQTEPIDIKTAQISKNTPMLVDFGRLSSFLYLSPG